MNTLVMFLIQSILQSRWQVPGVKGMMGATQRGHLCRLPVSMLLLKLQRVVERKVACAEESAAKPKPHSQKSCREWEHMRLGEEKGEEKGEEEGRRKGGRWEKPNRVGGEIEGIYSPAWWGCGMAEGSSPCQYFHENVGGDTPLIPGFEVHSSALAEANSEKNGKMWLRECLIGATGAGILSGGRKEDDSCSASPFPRLCE
jgi:hypothetical protein